MQPRLLSEPFRLAGGPILRLQSDERLVRLVRAGSHPAFAEIVHRYRPSLVRYTDRIVGAERGEDVVQQGLAGAHTALMADDRPITLKPWLYRIVHNAALNVLRSDREVVALDDHESELTVLSAETEAASRQHFRDTLRAVQALPAAQRDALLLRELEGRSHEEIASALGVSAGAARQHLMRARVTLRAAASAVMPFPLVQMAVAAGGGAAAEVAPVVATAGAGLTLGKLGAGILAAGAIAGGAGVVVPAVLPTAAQDQADGAERRAADRGVRARSAGRGPVAVDSAALLVTTRTDGDRSTAARRKGRQDDGGRDGSGGRRDRDRKGQRDRERGSEGRDDAREQRDGGGTHGTRDDGEHDAETGRDHGSGDSRSGRTRALRSESGDDDTPAGGIATSRLGSGDSGGSDSGSRTSDSGSDTPGSAPSSPDLGAAAGSGETRPDATTATKVDEPSGSGSGSGSGDDTPTLLP